MPVRLNSVSEFPYRQDRSTTIAVSNTKDGLTKVSLYKTQQWYIKDQYVSFGGAVWRALRPSLGKQPDLNLLDWEMVDLTPQSEGVSNLVNFTAGATIFGHRVVCLDGTSVRHPLLSNTLDAERVVGISIQSVSSGSQVAVAAFGPVSESSWAWPGGATLFVGDNGVLTTTPPTTGWIVSIARVASATSIIVDIQTPIFLEV